MPYFIHICTATTEIRRSFVYSTEVMVHFRY